MNMILGFGIKTESGGVIRPCGECNTRGVDRRDRRDCYKCNGYGYILNGERFIDTKQAIDKQGEPIYPCCNEQYLALRKYWLEHLRKIGKLRFEKREAEKQIMFIESELDRLGPITP